MRYLVRGRVKPGKEQALSRRSSVARSARLGRRRRVSAQHAGRPAFDDGTARWVEVCYCNVPLEEERPYWEEFFDLVKVQDAHARTNCRDENGSEPWAVANAIARNASKHGWPSRHQRFCRFSSQKIPQRAAERHEEELH